VILLRKKATAKAEIKITDGGLNFHFIYF